MKPAIKQYFQETKQWKAEQLLLRDIVLETGLQEEYKWKHPCYTHRGKNIVLIHGFLDFFALLFPKGALLSDPDKILSTQTKNVQSSRQIRFTSKAQVRALEKQIRDYIQEALRLEEEDKKVKLKKTSDYALPTELTTAFLQDKSFEKAFYRLTPGRQRGYILHFSAAKKSETRTARIRKYKSRIMDGFGIRDCTCGLTQKKPNCDGSHRRLHPNSKKNSSKS